MSGAASSSAVEEVLRTRPVAPSILAADFAHLSEQVGEVLAAGARVLHVDVMDGHFVPPITIGALIADAISEQVHDAGGIVDVHLMVEHPERHIDAFVEAGADIVTIHQEATPHVHHALVRIREAGCRAGLAVNPSTPVDVVSEVSDALDLVLCMSVNPGWGGQSLIPASVDKLARLRGSLPAGLPGCRSRSTAGSTSARPPSASVPVRRCWWRARPSSGRPIPARRSGASWLPWRLEPIEAGAISPDIAGR